MPRRPDPDLEGRILRAARTLWKHGGEAALTMRAVANAAETNTPAVYRRFRDRDDILRALLHRIRQEFAEVLASASTPEEACEQYLDYALSHPHEYELFYRYEYDLFSSPRAVRSGARVPGRPGRDAMKRKLAERFGGTPDDHTQLTIGLWMLAHGAATLMIGKTLLPGEVKSARAVFTAALAALLEKYESDWRGSAREPNTATGFLKDEGRRH